MLLLSRKLLMPDDTMTCSKVLLRTCPFCFRQIGQVARSVVPVFDFAFPIILCHCSSTNSTSTTRSLATANKLRDSTRETRCLVREPKRFDRLPMISY